MRFKISDLEQNAHGGGTAQDEANKWVMAGMQMSDLEIKAIVQSRAGLYAPMTIPKGTNDHRMILTGKHNWLFFLFDDLLERYECAAEMKEKALRVAKGTYPSNLADESDSRIWLLFDEVLSQARSQMDPYLFSRYLGCLSRFMDGVGEEICFRKANLIVDENTYRRVRRATSYMEACGVINGQFSMEIQLRPVDVECAAYADLVNAMIDHIIMVNDIFSFRKERFHEAVVINWMAVLMYHRKLSFQEAIYCLCDMIKEEELKIIKLQKELLDKAAESKNEDLARSAIAYPLVASGNLFWSCVAGRYHGYDNPWITGEPLSGVWLLHPKVTIIVPSLKCQKHLLLTDVSTEVEQQAD